MVGKREKTSKESERDQSRGKKDRLGIPRTICERSGTAADNSGASEGEIFTFLQRTRSALEHPGVKHSAEGDGEVEKGQWARWGLELHNNYKE